MKTFIPFLLFLLSFSAYGNPTSSEIYTDLQKFSSLKKALYIAAHPDDENTRALAYFSLGENAETAYFSLTRGDGGQNLIGDELSEDLGVLRTQELLAARSYDKAQQFFSRAVDFGYSKSAEETLEKWGKDVILADAVLMIRKFQPDVIITRFPPDGRGGHGHHTASALIAIEAFEKAADPNFLPGQVKEYGTWQTTAIYWNASNWWNKDLDKEAANNPDYIVRDIGGYNNILGQSYNEIGTIARSQHKCQGFGALLERGSRIEYFQYLAGTKLKEDFFEENKKNWKDLIDAEFEQKLSTLLKNFDFVNTENNISTLLELRNKLEKLPVSTFRQNKLNKLDGIILDCLGIYAQIQSEDYSIVQGEKVNLELSIINRSTLPVTLKSIGRLSLNKPLPQNEMIADTIPLTNNALITNPYWLRSNFTDIYTVKDKKDLLKPENGPTFSYPITLGIKGTTIQTILPVEHKWRDPSYGERSREVISVPAFSVNFDEKSIILKSGQTKTITLDIHSFKKDLNDVINIEVPNSWEVSQKEIPVNIKNKHESHLVKVELTAKGDSQRGKLVLKDSKGQTLYSYHVIEYEHIPTQVIFKKSALECIKLDAKIKPGKIAYIKGVEDVVPRAIQQLGFDLEVFEVADLSLLNLNKYQSVVLGIRIYNVHEELRNYEDKLFDYVNNGGNLVMQYNTASRSEPDKKFGGPLPFELSRNRVTEEDAEVTFLQPGHPIMTYPNQISEADFENWVQERGLYFANNWDEKYTPLFSWHDKGEEPQLGGLIVAKHGKGQFVYTGISFFRELPNGVEGAYKLFANLLSYGGQQGPR